MMNPEIKAQWVAALRSGNFLQGKGVLHEVRPHAAVGGADEHRFCCLGVLCESAIAAGILDREPLHSDGNVFKYVPKNPSTYEGDHWFLPSQAREWAEMDASDPTVHYAGHNRRISELNDEGVPFAVIADIIEEQL